MRWFLSTYIYFSEDARVQQIGNDICGEIPVFLRCPDVDPMLFPRIGALEHFFKGRDMSGIKYN